MEEENLTQRAQAALTDQHITRREIGDRIHELEQAGLTLTPEYAALTLAYSDTERRSAKTTEHALCGR